jgi:DNA (cytosine-5)-methyltransferase 1
MRGNLRDVPHSHEKPRPYDLAVSFSVADIFSGAGGMSFGFHAHRDFRVVGAADAQIGKPSSRLGSLRCNDTYRANIGVDPLEVDLSRISPSALREVWGLRRGELDVLLACPPCSGFSRITAANHLRDDPRNSLVGRIAVYAEELRPRTILVENARELVKGRQRHHFDQLAESLMKLGYDVAGGTHLLSDYGLPQLRERTLLVAVDAGLPLRTLDDVWEGLQLRPAATGGSLPIASCPPSRPASPTRTTRSTCRPPFPRTAASNGCAPFPRTAVRGPICCAHRTPPSC